MSPRVVACWIFLPAHAYAVLFCLFLTHSTTVLLQYRSVGCVPVRYECAPMSLEPFVAGYDHLPVYYFTDRTKHLVGTTAVFCCTCCCISLGLLSRQLIVPHKYWGLSEV